MPVRSHRAAGKLTLSRRGNGSTRANLTSCTTSLNNARRDRGSSCSLAVGAITGRYGERKQMADPKIAAAALIWLRNWIDAGNMFIDLKMQEKVLKRIDAVIDDQDVSINDMKAFKERYPYPTEEEK